MRWLVSLLNCKNGLSVKLQNYVTYVCFLQYGTYFLRFEAINENYKPIFAKRFFYRNSDFFNSKNIWQFYSSKYCYYCKLSTLLFDEV